MRVENREIRDFGTDAHLESVWSDVRDALHVAASGRLGWPGTDIKNGRNWTFLRSFGSLDFEGRVFCIYSFLFLSMKIIGST